MKNTPKKDEIRATTQAPATTQAAPATAAAKKDELFKDQPAAQFEFNASVASVFDDMANRSIPFYAAAQQLFCDYLALALPHAARVVDLGCSTATTLLNLAQRRGDLRLVGIDAAPEMLALARQKAQAYGAKIELICGDILDVEFGAADAFVLNYSLQFVRPLRRAGLLARVAGALGAGGVLVLGEKLAFADARFARQVIALYEGYKAAQGYTRSEIAAKRAALENVLVPFTRAENEAMLADAGFARVETLFTWGNFATFLAFK